jgi:outer membrane protein assembly factor BamB
MKRTIFFVFSLLLLTSATLTAADWNQWRGPDHDGISRETGLSSKWSESGPKLLWRNDALGVGYSNFSFSDNMIFSMGDRGDSCFLFALDAKSGKEIWNLKIGKAGGGGGYHGPRGTPATDGKFVFALGQFGDFVCANAKTGQLIWKGNVETELGGKVMSGWSFSMSPVIDENQIVLPIGGEQGTVIALERNEKGLKIRWRSKEVTDAAAYNSVVPITLGGTRQYLIFTDKRVAGLEAKTGQLLWQASCPGKVAVCSDPTYWQDGEDSCYVIAASAYKTGARGFKISGKGKNFDAEELYYEQKLENHHGGIVQVGGHFYLLTQRELVCVDPKTGKTLWSNRSVGKGSILAVDNKLIVRSESGDGEVALVEVSPNEYKELARFSQPDRTDKNSWTYPTVFNGKLYIRDQNLLLCYEVK